MRYVGGRSMFTNCFIDAPERFSMTDTGTVTTITDNVTPLRPVTPRRASRRASRKAANERQRRYRARKAEQAAAIGSPIATGIVRNLVTRPQRADDLPESLVPQQLSAPADVEVLPPRSVMFPSPRVSSELGKSTWSAIGRAAVGLAIIGVGAFIAFTSMRANSWFGHSLTPDPVAGEVYSHLSVAAEVIACLIPTASRFYMQSGEWWTALRGWLLLAVALVVVFFAAGGFAVTNLNAGVEARAERSTGETMLAQRRLDTLTKSRAAECAKRGPLCRKLEAEEQAAIESLEQARVDVKAEADPQAAALGITSGRLHAIQAGSMVALCLFSGLFISFGAGLIWGRPR
jgi:hypothetical protein